MLFSAAVSARNAEDRATICDHRSRAIDLRSAAAFAVFKQLQDAFYAGDRATYDKLTAPEHARISSGGMVRFGTENSVAVDGPRNPVKFSNISVQAWDQLGVVRWTETNAAGQQQWLTRVLAKKAGDGSRLRPRAARPVIRRSPPNRP